MFITEAQFEDRVAATLGPPGARYYVATELSTCACWYLLTWRASPEHPSQTMAVAWERVLISLVRLIQPRHELLSLRIVSIDDAPGSWTMQPVHQLWLPQEDEEETTGPLIVRVGDQRRRLLSSFLHEVEERSSRQLLAETLESRRGVVPRE